MLVSPLPVVHDPPRLAVLTSPPAEDPQPGAPKWARGHRVPPAVVLAAVVRAIEAVHQATVNPERCATDARHILALQRATLTPWGELADEIELVARWARESSDQLAENDIRGTRANGDQWGADRSRSVSTICVQARWSDRLAAARRWEAGEGPRARGEHPSERGRSKVAAPEPEWQPLFDDEEHV